MAVSIGIGSSMWISRAATGWWIPRTKPGASERGCVGAADQVRRREKTVTRRVGWRMLGAGDRLTLCPKVRGRRRGEPLERIVTVHVVSVRRERLDLISVDDVVAEGFPGMSPEGFVEFFCRTHAGVVASSEVTRIQWRYPRVCRRCGCTDDDACLTALGPCAWLTVFNGETGVCTACS